VIITSRPLYVPQLLQTKCGSFASPHCGQTALGAAIKREFELRRECILARPFFLFGTAIVLPSSGDLFASRLDIYKQSRQTCKVPKKDAIGYFNTSFTICGV